MGGHAHSHGGTAASAHRSRLVAVLVPTLAVAAVQVVGGVLSGSFALVADAGHMLTDAAGVGLALGATALAARPATAVRTFGRQRAEMLAALANGVVIGVVAVLVVVGGVRRLVDPQEVEAPLILAVAVVGLVANGVGLALLHRGQRESLNVRGAYLEVLGDLRGCLAGHFDVDHCTFQLEPPSQAGREAHAHA